MNEPICLEELHLIFHLFAMALKFYGYQSFSENPLVNLIKEQNKLAGLQNPVTKFDISSNKGFIFLKTLILTLVLLFIKDLFIKFMKIFIKSI